MNIIFFGTPVFVLPIIESLRQNFNLVKVVSSKTPDIEIKNLAVIKPDLFVVAAYGKIIPQLILDIPKFGSLNIHPSLLPKYRGASPIQAAILNGDHKTGISIIKIDKQMDHGPIIYQDEYTISSEDTLESLSQELFLHAAEILPKVIRDFISGQIIPKPQPDAQASYTWKTLDTKKMAYVDLENLPTPAELDLKIRAFYPEPGAWTIWRSKHIKFLPDGKVQMAGKKAVLLKDFLNGYPEFPIRR